MSDEERVKEFNYHLRDPISYAASGDTTEAQYITLFAPAAKHSKECAALKQAFFRSIPDDAEADASAAAETDMGKMGGLDVMTIISMSKDVDMGEVIDVAKVLFSNPSIAKIDGEQKLTRNLIDQLSQEDLEVMTGEYMVNFIIASVVRAQRTRSEKSSSD